MKLYETLPRGVTVDHKFYRMDFEFRNVLRMTEILQRDDLIDEAREYLALKCLMKHPKNVHAVLDAVRGLLFEQKPSQDSKKITSFVQDAPLIRAAFWQEYKINLYRDKLHWFEFIELFQNLPEGSRYSDVIGIRARPMPKPTKWNAEERQWLLKAKASVALKMTDKEQEDKYNQDVENIFNVLMGMIKKDGGAVE